MPSGKQAIKRRIRSVEATKKITQAMEMIAISKYQKQKQILEKNKEYSDTLERVCAQILKSAEKEDIFWMKELKEDDNPLSIVLTSDLGLCGAYNANVLKHFKKQAPKGSYLVVGIKGYSWFKYRNFKLSRDLIHSDDLNFKSISDAMIEVIQKYREGEISSIRVYYTKFHNSVNFEPDSKQLLPFLTPESDEKDVLEAETIFEPNAQVILDQMIPMTIISMVYRLYLESKTSEQASRRIAMENATDNAEEIVDHLTLKYNQSRQAAITQEISEIIAGADAL
jgi:F-type H+-transporting ATPase subunit gamma